MVPSTHGKLRGKTYYEVLNTFTASISDVDTFDKCPATCVFCCADAVFSSVIWATRSTFRLISTLTFDCSFIEIAMAAIASETLSESDFLNRGVDHIRLRNAFLNQIHRIVHRGDRTLSNFLNFRHHV